MTSGTAGVMVVSGWTSLELHANIPERGLIFDPSALRGTYGGNFVWEHGLTKIFDSKILTNNSNPRPKSSPPVFYVNVETLLS